MATDCFFQNKLKAKTKSEEEIFSWITKLKVITDALKVKRLKVGYDFRSNEIEMILDENTNLKSITLASQTPSHSLIEDCMLLANKAAASMIDFGIFRVHNFNKIEQFIFSKPEESDKLHLELTQNAEDIFNSYHPSYTFRYGNGTRCVKLD